MNYETMTDEIKRMLVDNDRKWQAAIEADNERDQARCHGASNALLTLWDTLQKINAGGAA